MDLLLVELGLFSSRNKAQTAIRKGEVTVEGELIKTPSTKFKPDARINVAPQDPYPGRGGIKLARALEQLNFDPNDMIVLDGGASTGGFTSCLLQRGARKVYAVDVGKNQLDSQLRVDPRVIVVENYNLRYFSPDLVKEKLDLIVLDLSFISATKVIPVLEKALKDGGFFLTLVKPQFEVGPGKIGKKGLVRNDTDQFNAVTKVVDSKKANKLGFVGLVPASPKGVSGNQEFFLLSQKGGERIFSNQDWLDCRARIK